MKMDNKIFELDKDIDVYTLSINKDANDSGEGGTVKFDLNAAKSIEIDKIGKYLYTNDAYHHTGMNYNGTLAEEFLKALNKENVTKEYLSNNVSTVYRFPNLTLSRDKLAILKEDCNFKVIRDRNKADIIIISEKTIEKMTSMTYKDAYNVSTIREIFKDYSSKFTYDNNINHIKYHIDYLESLNDNDIITLDNNWYRDDDVTDPDYLTFLLMSDAIEKKSSERNTDGRYTHYVNDFATYKYLIDNANKIVIDNHINKLCVEDSVSFLQEDFERLEQLLKSGDTENINIGLTLMANCNVEGSRTVLSLMFAFYSEGMKGAKVWNHVNFKYLRKIYENYINMTMSSWGNAYDHLIKHMCKDKCLNMWASRYIANSMFINVLQNNCGAFTKESVFITNVESLQLKDEYKNQITNDEADISELINTVDVLPF